MSEGQRTWTDPEDGVQYRVNEGRIEVFALGEWHVADTVPGDTSTILALADLLAPPRTG